jgi:hypothetical protein
MTSERLEIRRPISIRPGVSTSDGKQLSDEGELKWQGS